MGCSCDWQRTRFTLDDVCARAVRETFFSSFKEGKIYRGKRLVNWDTFLQTAVSDDEVFHETVKGHFWHFNYPVIDPEAGRADARDHRHDAAGNDARRYGRGRASRSGRRIEISGSGLWERLADAPAKEKPEIEAQIDEVSAGGAKCCRC